MKIFILILLMPTFLLAQYAGDNPRREVFLRVVHVDGDKAMSADEAYDVYQYVAKYYTANTDIELLPSGFVSIEDPEPEDFSQTSFVLNRRIWFHVVESKLLHKARRREIILIIDRPLYFNGEFITGGSAHRCALYNQADHAHIYGGNHLSLIQAIHEVGHALGASHNDETSSIMNTNPYSSGFSLDDNSKKQIKSCVKRETRKKIRFCRKKAKRPRVCLRKWRLR